MEGIEVEEGGQICMVMGGGALSSCGVLDFPVSRELKVLSGK